MSNEQEIRVLDLVAEALAIDLTDRAQWLREQCGDDPSLLSEVESLLGFNDDAAELLHTSDNQTVGLRTATLDASAVPEAWALFRQGDRLGDYEIKRPIGAGGMGIVYEALQISLNRIVALKVLPAHLSGSQTALTRFQREVEAAARLQHDNIVAVHTTGREDGNSFYAMELIDGPALSDVLTDLRHNPLPELQSTDTDAKNDSSDSARRAHAGWLAAVDNSDSANVRAEKAADSSDPARPSRNYFEIVAEMLASVADGLEYAHRNEIVHRDIKPSNLLLSSDGRLHISDFGLARIMAEPSVTQTGDIVGTPFYMAPEQISSDVGQIDGRTDIYALGATLYEMLTLQPPYPGTSRDEVLAKIRLEELVRPSKINKRVPLDMETICLQALAKEPARRYQTAGEMAEDLRRYAAHWPIKARRSGILDRGMKWCRRHQAMTASLLVAGFLGLMATFLAYRTYESSREKDIAEQQRDDVEARASRMERAVIRAHQTEQERVFEAALVAAMQGDQEAAEAAVDRAEQLGASPERLLILSAQSALVRGELDWSIKELEDAIEISPNNFAANALLAEAFARIDKWKHSRDLLEKVNALEPQSTEDLILKGRMQSFHDPIVAEQTLDEAIAIDKKNVAARLIRGTIRAKATHTNVDADSAERALADFRQAAIFSDETTYLLGELLGVNLTAASAYEAQGDTSKRQKHLNEAAMLADKLAAYPNDFQARRWRAFYYEQVDDLDSAIEEWQAIQKRRIGFVVMALYRAGRFDEALAACDSYRAATGTSDFCHSFTMAAIADSAEQLIADFRFDRQIAWNHAPARRSLHYLWSLAGKPDRATAEVRQLGIDDKTAVTERDLFAYVCEETTADEYLSRSSGSRYAQAKAHLAIGLRHLSFGQRDIARDHFQRAVDRRMNYEFSTAIARALLTQLERSPSWPAWIDQE